MPNQEEAITPQVFDHLVSLAALELDPQEAQYLRRELNQQLAAVRELEAIRLPDDLPLAAHGVPYPPERRQALRPDRHAPFGDSQAIVDLAPQVEDNSVVVPDIPHITLE
jgi:aspartyl-tRNA(Asn)/glutamyl-tRNA(Gln) amidotransferase subunit C